MEDRRINVAELLREFPSTGEGMILGDLTGTIPLGGFPERYYAVSSSPLDDHGHRGNINHSRVGQGGREDMKNRIILIVALSVIDDINP